MQPFLGGNSEKKLVITIIIMTKFYDDGQYILALCIGGTGIARLTEIRVCSGTYAEGAGECSRFHRNCVASGNCSNVTNVTTVIIQFPFF